MDLWLKIGQVVVAVLLTVVILMQNKGGGVGGVFGGGGGGVYTTKRGFEKKLYVFTIILAILFVLVSLLAFWIKA
ncbi:MAG TPA: preprotein translocase subunit SecG [Patescibacteria group bacterium]|nr:preprotein translocase subunit SecG [Patescibacteria group bacterium]